MTKVSPEFTALRATSEDDRSIRGSFERTEAIYQEEDHEKLFATEQRATWKQKTWNLWANFAPFPWKTFLIVGCLPLAMAPIVALARAAESVSRNYMQGRDCYPNGLWSEAPNASWRIMDSSYFFTPNLSFGSMSFTTAKMIDIFWDVGVGRGGQVLLAYVNYIVFNEWLLYHMEMHLTSYKMYTALAFGATSLSTLGVLTKEFLAFGESSWRRLLRWMAMLSMILSTLYVISFPTLMAAMTGYITTYQPYILDMERNLVEYSKFIPVEFIIMDSSRIGQYSKPLLVTRPDTDLMSAVYDYVTPYHGYDRENDPACHGHCLSPLQRNWPAYVRPWDSWSWDDFEYAFNNSSTWKFEGREVQLDSPSLHIQWLELVMSTPYPDVKVDRYWYTDGGRQGNLYNASYLLTHASCKPSETYQWGFSYIFLFMVSIFHFLWSCIMVGMWFDTVRASRMYKSGRRPGLLRSVLDLARVLREELGDQAEDLEEQELRKAVRETGGALLVPVGATSIQRVRDGHIGEGVRKRGWKKSLTSGSTF